MSVELSVIIPTFNEKANLQDLFEKLECALDGVVWEVIVVDDNSPDGTYQFVKELAAIDIRVRCIRRVNRRGLSGACIEGILSSSAPFVAVIDGDLQHDEKILPLMLRRLRSTNIDIVIGSRYVDRGSASYGFSQWREFISVSAAMIARWILRLKFNDIMSGFFMVRREVVENIAPQLSPAGFKILLDIMTTGGSDLKYEEIGYHFRSRSRGDSKLDVLVVFDFLGLLLNKTSRQLLPTRFLVFATVGLTGVLAHAVIFYVCFFGMNLSFFYAQAIATCVAMTSNFFCNNVLTYRDIRLRGRELLLGLLRFYFVCSAGALANISIATVIYMHYPYWLPASAAGVIMGSVWNYSLSSFYVWNNR